MRISDKHDIQGAVMVLELPIKGAPHTSNSTAYVQVDANHVDYWYVPEPNLTWQFNKPLGLPELVEGNSRRVFRGEKSLCKLHVGTINEIVGKANFPNEDKELPSIPLIEEIKLYYSEIIAELNDLDEPSDDNELLQISYMEPKKATTEDLDTLVSKCLLNVNYYSEQLDELVELEEAESVRTTKEQSMLIKAIEDLGSLYALYRMELKVRDLLD